MKTTRVLGLMSGTSLDGVDLAWCRFGAGAGRLEDRRHVSFPAALRHRLGEAAEGRSGSHELAQLHHDLGRFYARAALRGSRAGLDLCGLHGQTIYHHPRQRTPATFQLGESSYLAAALGVPVIHNFRAADLAVGGQGAPLATAFHVAAFGRRGRHVCVQNLGGIGNVTSIDRRGPGPARVLSFDTGPGNLLLDLAARHYSQGKLAMDREGRLAGRGRIRESLLRRWLRHAYFRRRPPKSTGRELFGESWWGRFGGDLKGISAPDALATLSALTARSIALHYRRDLPGPPDRVILAGGGAANPVLVRHIGQALDGAGLEVDVSVSDEWGWPKTSVEAAAFAWLAWRRWRGKAGNLPETTGARRAVRLGQVTEIP